MGVAKTEADTYWEQFSDGTFYVDMFDADGKKSSVWAIPTEEEAKTIAIESLSNGFVRAVVNDTIRPGFGWPIVELKMIDGEVDQVQMTEFG